MNDLPFSCQLNTVHLRESYVMKVVVVIGLVVVGLISSGLIVIVEIAISSKKIPMFCLDFMLKFTALILEVKKINLINVKYLCLKEFSVLHQKVSFHLQYWS